MSAPTSQDNVNSRINKLMAFMQHDWENDKLWKSYIDKEKLDKLTKEELEYMKRTYYSTNVEKDLDKILSFENEDERKEYASYCKYYGNMGTLGF